MALMELASTALAGGAGLLGGYFQNEANKKNAREANAWNQESSQKQMDFQERMSNSAHQREMADLKKAGLNPLLTGTGGAGASSPVGASGAGSAASSEDAIGKGVASAGDIARLGLAMKKQKAEVSNLEETNKLIKDQQNKTKMETTVMQKGIPEQEATNMLWNSVKDAWSSTSKAWKNLRFGEGNESNVRRSKPSINPNPAPTRDYETIQLRMHNRR